jgi:hypothetical protein
MEDDVAEPEVIADAVAVEVASLPGDPEPEPEPLGGYTNFPSSLHEYISGK